MQVDFKLLFQHDQNYRVAMPDDRIHPFPSRDVSVAQAPVRHDRFRGHEHALQLTSPKKTSQG
jgi:hypothetical protein